MIAIVDYGVGNIKAFANIYKNLNMAYTIAGKKEDLRNVNKIILPGVGAFDHAMERLNKSGMREILDELVLNKKVPVLGICVGMQMLAKSSEEGNLKGLGWISGVVKKFDLSGLNEITPLPHMGWNDVTIIKKDSALLREMNKELRFYFLHSYYFECNNNENIIATVDYGGSFASVINSENIYGIQCHPEKSHHNGMQLLKNFGEL